MSSEVIYSKLSCLFFTDDDYVSAPGSFVFSLRNNDDLGPFKAPLREKAAKNAISRKNRNGPTFGSGYDLHIASNSGSNHNSLTTFGSSYTPPSEYTAGKHNTQSLLAGSYHFKPSEIEVLYLN